MSNRSVRKLRHREDVKPMPSFKERMLAGQRGETVCPNPYCRKFAKDIVPGMGCNDCISVPPEVEELLKKRIADLDSGKVEVLSSEEVHKQLQEHIGHVHGPDCNHDH